MIQEEEKCIKISPGFDVGNNTKREEKREEKKDERNQYDMVVMPPAPF